MTKKFLVQFTDDANTRWLADDAQLARTLEAICKSVGHSHSSGTVPAVTVTVEEAPEQKPCGLGASCPCPACAAERS